MFKLVVLFSVLAFAAAKPGVVVPLSYSYGAVPAVSSVSQYSVHGASAWPLYRSALSPVVVPAAVPLLSQPAHSPAVVLDPVNGVPLDTPEVVAARVAHYQAKALAGVHHLAKRSVVAPVAYSSIVAPVSHSVVSPLAYSTPYVSAYSSPYVSTYSSPYVSPYSVSAYPYSAVVPKALSVHPY